MKNVSELKSYFETIFPERANRYDFLEIGDGYSILRLIPSSVDLRPGRTISGPSMFELADCAFYAAILFKDNDPMSVTVNCSINFFNRPQNQSLFAKASIVKFGKKLVVGDVSLYSEKEENRVAQAVMTYARAVKKQI
jgi:uncharacterized protein (TIGR00369 family)